MEFSHGGGSVPASHSGKIIVPWEPDPRITDKWCYRCRRFKPFSEFHRNVVRNDGLSGECRLCDNMIRGESRAKRRNRV